MRRACLSLVIASLAASSTVAGADEVAPSLATFEVPTVMDALAHHDLHDLDDEGWNVYGQFTYIWTYKAPFAAKYTNLNGTPDSLSPNAERGFTGTFTVFGSARLWPGAQAVIVPEVIAEQPLSGLHGLSSIQNGELQKNGVSTPQIYRARAYLQQTFSLGGDRVLKPSGPQQVAMATTSRRIVISAGNFTILDFFDKNSFAGDPRGQFFNMNFMTQAAWDFASDARGYSYGAVVEVFWDAWAARFGRLTPPKDPNVLPVDFRLDEHYGDQLELEHDHTLLGQAGAVRVLGYRNQEVMGRFADAISAFEANPADNAAACAAAGLFNYQSSNSSAPDLCWARKQNVKLGIGLNLEQHLTDDIGVFARAMYSDGQTEVDAYTSADRSFAFGALGKGTPWNRPRDVTGVGFSLNTISSIHAEYLKMGGVDGFIGDGTIHQGPESVLEVFYSVNVFRFLWLSGDYQHITNPGFNVDRGPVEIFNARVHAEL